METIKFRVWDKSLNKMLYNGGVVWSGNEVKHFLGETMQFTGLHDKNGKEIYEGDIKLWKFSGRLRCYVCYWSDIDCGFRWKLVKHNEKQQDHDIDIPFETEEDFYNYVINRNQRNLGFDSFSELVGNIHENPELLK